MTVLSPVAKTKFFDNNGAPASAYKLFTYVAGTSTKLATYTDSTGGTPNANPILLDYRGECNLWIPPNVAYKYVFASPTDTDPPGAPIWSVDNIVNSQLVTLYGGVDTGIANAYVLNFTANFTSYTDGIVIYWIPSHTQTALGATINVNGLGSVAIFNSDGSPIGAGQIRANQPATLIYKGGSFFLMSVSTGYGQFLGAITGVIGPVSTLFTYAISGTIVILTTPNINGTSNANTCTITGLPAAIQPLANQRMAMPAYSFKDNGALVNDVAASISTGSPSVLTFEKAGSSTGFTNAGIKGFGVAGNVISWSLV